MKKSPVFILIIFLGLLAFQGCAALGFEDESSGIYRSAGQLVEEGAYAFESKKYKKALKIYSQLKDWYPFSRWAILAELRIADSNFELEHYDEALSAYEDFEELHPKNDAIVRIIYRQGLCWYRKLDAIDRDNSPAEKAIVQFQRLIERFPGSKYVASADKMIADCVNQLSSHELYVAEFYFKSGKYEAALNRYKYLVENYPTSKHAAIALSSISKTQKILDTPEE